MFGVSVCVYIDKLLHNLHERAKELDHKTVWEKNKVGRIIYLDFLKTYKGTIKTVVLVKETGTKINRTEYRI